MVTKELKLSTGVKYPLLDVLGEHIYVQGAMRDTLTFKFDPALVDYSAVDAALGSRVLLSPLTIVETTESVDQADAAQVNVDEYRYDGFFIKVKSSKERELVSPESFDAPAQYRDVIAIQMGQTTYGERQVDEIRRALDDNTELLVDLIGGALDE